MSARGCAHAGANGAPDPRRRRRSGRLGRGLATLAFLAGAGGGTAQAELRWHCPQQFATLQSDLPAYLASLDIPAGQVVLTADRGAGTITLALATPPEDTGTLDFHRRPEYALTAERVLLPTGRGPPRAVATVSRKEIVLALLQRGRIGEFAGDACSLEALADHVGVRQHIVAWAERLHWIWPDGGPAKWNSRYWSRGTPRPGVPLHAAIMDVFLYQDRYTIGCYVATKLVVVQGVLDYYRRVKKDRVRARRVEQVLLADGEPLVGIEPGGMWSFEKDFRAEAAAQPGKLLTLQAGVAPGNFVPGDWAYLLNTDETSSRKTGYEGSNAIYLGGGRFDDYYNDHRHSYTYEQKLNEVYQWRHGVFNRVRDADKARSLAPEELARLGSTPAEGGIQLDIRVAPRHF